jgi:serine/threonine protein kinase
MQKIGKYNVLGEIGKGGTSVVYRAVDPMLEREVAIKTQSVDVVQNEESIQRFLREARLVASLEHRNIVTVFELGQEGNRIYIVMELLRGEDLGTRLRSGRHLSLESKLRIVSEAARGLAHAHRKGVIHRDVKPRNVFLTDDGQVKLLDFGLAHIAQSTLTATGQVMGTPHYMSPEQILGRKPDARSDIFSLGALFHELLTGRKAFDATTLQEVFDRILAADPEPVGDLAPAIAEELSQIVSRMMRKSMEDRYPDVGRLLEDLTRFRRQLESQKVALRTEVGNKARRLRTLLARQPMTPRHESRESTERLLNTVDREDLSFMALVGLRDGIDIELWRLERRAVPLEDPRASDRRKAEAAFEDARSRFAIDDLAGCLVRVSEALRLSPEHSGAGVLAEELRQAVVARAVCFEEKEDLDVLVAALLAFDEGDSEKILGATGSRQDPETIARLSEFLLAELPDRELGESTRAKPGEPPPLPGGASFPRPRG